MQQKLHWETIILLEYGIVKKLFAQFKFQISSFYISKNISYQN